MCEFAALFANSQFADKPDLGFQAFANAASFRACGTPVAALQRTPPVRSFNRTQLIQI